PVVVTRVGGEPGSIPEPGMASELPLFEFPEPAAAALGLAWRYAQIRSAPRLHAVRPPGIDADAARALVSELLASRNEWLGPLDAAALLTRYGIPTFPQRLVIDADGAVQAAAELGYPVAIKATGAVHKTEVGGGRLGIGNADGVRAAWAALRAAA